MYSVPPSNKGADTTLFGIYVVDVEHPGPPKLVGHNYGVDWFDNDHILIVDNARSYIASLSGGPTRPFFSDSVLVWSIWDLHHLGYYDRRVGKQGWWVVETEKLDGAGLLKQTGDPVMPVLRGTARRVSSASNFFNRWTSRSSSDGFVLQYEGQGKVRKIWFTGHNDELLSPTFPGMSNRSIEVSRDGKDIVYVAPRLSARLILVENLFR
jgi:hypothetical protein